MNVFLDYGGHSDLYYALHLLFEKRLGGQLFCREGPEWHNKFIIKHTQSFRSRKIETIEDALKHPYITCERVEVIDGVYHYHRKMEVDRGHFIQRAITFNKFLKMDFDIIVTTLGSHEKSFHSLVRRFKPDAVFIRHIGNIHEKPHECKNVLLSTYEPMPPGVNYIRYHPEQYEGYCYTPPTNHDTINNFANNLPHYKRDLRAWEKCEGSMKSFTFKMHGQDGRDRFIPHLLMPRAMKDSAFIWHVKAHGGGGFVARQALACGRPCMIRRKYAVIHNELTTRLFVDSVNCVDLDLGVERGIQKIREWSQPDRHVQVCQATAEKFKRDVNFAAEAEKIKAWISSLQRK